MKMITKKIRPLISYIPFTIINTMTMLYAPLIIISQKNDQSATTVRYFLLAIIIGCFYFFLFQIVTSVLSKNKQKFWYSLAFILLNIFLPLILTILSMNFMS